MTTYYNGNQYYVSVNNPEELRIVIQWQGTRTGEALSAWKMTVLQPKEN